MTGYYDRIARTYDKRWRRYSELTHQMVLEALPESFTDVLDIGCGTGRLLQLLTADRSLRISGVDASEAMLEVARERLGHAARLYHGNGVSTLPAGTFDLILLANDVHYFAEADMLKLLPAIRSRLNQGGKLVVVDFGRDSRAVRYCWPLLTRIDQGVQHVYERSEFEQLLQESGFTVDIKRQQSLGFWWQGWLLRAQAA